MKGAYGLTDAPREWFAMVDRDLRDRGWTAATMELDLYMKYGAKDELTGMIIFNEDCFQTFGADSSEDYQPEIENLWKFY